MDNSNMERGGSEVLLKPETEVAALPETEADAPAAEALPAEALPTAAVLPAAEALPAAETLQAEALPAAEVPPAVNPPPVTEAFRPAEAHAFHEPKKKSYKAMAAIVAMASILGGLSLGIGIGVVNTAAKIMLPTAEAPAAPAEDPAEILPLVITPSSAPSLDENLPGSFNQIFAMVEPSVVDISSVLAGNQNYYGLPETPRGSGILFKEDDERVYIVTNNHVISGAESVNVSVSGAEPVEAGLAGRDQASDIAVIFLKKSDLAAVGVNKVTLAKLGDSDKMQTGDIVLAIGNALGEGNTATQGIISAKNKEISVEGIKLTVIQTDAAINPGNSGGPLVNMRGEVIGINTAKTMQQYIGSSAEGMGYSIASNIILPLVEEIVSAPPKAFLGIRGKTLPAEMAEQFNLPEIGVLVDEVIEGTAAADAGIKRTDIITSFKGQAVFTMADLQEAIRLCAVNEEVEVKLLRDGRSSVTLTLRLQADENGNF